MRSSRWIVGMKYPDQVQHKILKLKQDFFFENLEEAVSVFLLVDEDEN